MDVKTWTLSGDMIKRIEAVEMWFLGTMLGNIMDRQSPQMKFYKMSTEKLLNDIFNRQIKFFGRVFRIEGLEKPGSDIFR